QGRGLCFGFGLFVGNWEPMNCKSVIKYAVTLGAAFIAGFSGRENLAASIRTAPDARAPSRSGCHHPRCRRIGFKLLVCLTTPRRGSPYPFGLTLVHCLLVCRAMSYAA